MSPEPKALAIIAAHVAGTNRRLDDVTADSGGTAISTRQAAA